MDQDLNDLLSRHESATLAFVGIVDVVWRARRAKRKFWSLILMICKLFGALRKV